MPRLRRARRVRKTRFTVHASDLGSGIEVLDLIREHTTRTDQDNVERLLREGAEMGGALHAYAHGREWWHDSVARRAHGLAADREHDAQ